MSGSARREAPVGLSARLTCPDWSDRGFAVRETRPNTLQLWRLGLPDVLAAGLVALLFGSPVAPETFDVRRIHNGKNKAENKKKERWRKAVAWNAWETKVIFLPPLSLEGISQLSENRQCHTVHRRNANARELQCIGKRETRPQCRTQSQFCWHWARESERLLPSPSHTFDVT